VNNHVEGKEVRVAALCNYCKSRLSGPSIVGTSQLRRHIKACKKKMCRGLVPRVPWVIGYGPTTWTRPTPPIAKQLESGTQCQG
jgi:hypothetical protein